MDDDLMDIDDYFEEQNQKHDDDKVSLEDIILEDIIDRNLVDPNKLWENCDKGAKLIADYDKEVFFELYEKRVRGCGYKEELELYEKKVRGWGYRYKLEEFIFRIPRIKNAYAIDGELHLEVKRSIHYIIPNLKNVELLAFLINRQMGVYSENEEKASTE